MLNTLPFNVTRFAPSLSPMKWLVSPVADLVHLIITSRGSVLELRRGPIAFTSLVRKSKSSFLLNSFEAIHLVFLVNYNNKIKTLYNWVVAYVTRDQALHMIFRSENRENRIEHL
jgi:hypothetical protein